jgi:hypothetical protein
VANLWSFTDPGTAIVVTTNGYVKHNGDAVMGRGVALQAAEYEPKLPGWLGAAIRRDGNHVFMFQVGRYYVYTMPVKHHWRERADELLIARSASELVVVARAHGWDQVVVPRPGCGNGGLLWSDVKPIVEPLFDDRYLVVTQQEETSASRE